MLTIVWVHKMATKEKSKVAGIFYTWKIPYFFQETCTIWQFEVFFQLFTAINEFSSELINVQSQIRAYWWEKFPKSINVPRMFIWTPRVGCKPSHYLC